MGDFPGEKFGSRCDAPALIVVSYSYLLNSLADRRWYQQTHRKTAFGGLAVCAGCLGWLAGFGNEMGQVDLREIGKL